MSASEQSCGWAVTMARGPARQQRQLPVQGRPARGPGYSFVPLAGNGPVRARNGWLSGRAVHTEKKGALSWGGVWG